VPNGLLAVGLLCVLCVILSSCGNAVPSTKQVPAASPPLLKWKVSLAELVNTNPVADGGVVYVTTEEYVYALDVASGSVKWKVASPGYIVSSPAVANGLLYIGSTSLPDMDTRIAKVTAYALDTQTGEIRWQQTLSNDRSEDSSNPVVADGLVYFGTGWSDYTCCELRGNGGHLTALDGATGRLVWQVDTKGDYGSGGLPTTTFGVARGILYVGVGYAGPDLPEKQLHALDGKTGTELWQNASDVAFPSVTPDGSLFSVVEQQLVRYDGKTGREIWRWDLDPTKDSLSRPTVVGDTVYVVGNQARDICFEAPCSTPKNHTDALYALDSANGQERWRQDVSGGYYGTRDLSLFQQYLCYEVADFSGETRHWYLRAVGRNDGTYAWQVDLDNTVFGLPVVADDTMYLATSEGTIYALQLP
jgi:outer membrane protein assembly factor BamB